MGFAVRRRVDWQLRTRALALGERTVLMGILNVTPDSFSDGGRYYSEGTAVDQGLRLLDEGADVLDVGGESTRPGAVAVGEDEEQRRVLGVIRALVKARPGVVISADTYHAGTARAAVEAGVEIVNDVSGLLWDEAMAGVMAETGVGAVLMHTRGRPGEWGSLPGLRGEEVLPMVERGLGEALGRARAAGVADGAIVLDAGFGFGKRGGENFRLLKEFGELLQLGFPMLAAVSRKRFLGGGVEASSAAHVAAVLAGASVLRVHDVVAARVAADVADAILEA